MLNVILFCIMLFYAGLVLHVPGFSIFHNKKKIFIFRFGKNRVLTLESVNAFQMKYTKSRDPNTIRAEEHVI